MSKLTELEQNADREARHGHRELVEKLEVRVAELEAALARQIDLNASAVAIWADNAAAIERTAWNDAIRAAADLAENAGEVFWKWRREEISGRIRTLLRNEGGSDDQ